MAYPVDKLLKAQELARAGVIFAPASFLLASEQQLVATCNGCGASESWFRPPETMHGTNISAACIVHDWMYSEGSTIEDKEEADRSFLNNLLRLIERDSHKWYKPTNLQRARALLYYQSVKIFGGPAFWNGKLNIA